MPGSREESADHWTAESGQQRWVLGSMGPGTKLPTLGHAPYATLRDAYQTQTEGMIAGGIDAVLVETSQDLLQTKASILGAKRAMKAIGVDIPVIAQVTVETTGTMLVGSEIGAALTALETLGIELIGLNCATGPAEMSEHLRYLAKHARIGVSCMPNAGLPVLGPNGAHYPLGAADFAEAHGTFIREYGLSLVGGCCGTTPEHLRALVEKVRETEKGKRKVRHEAGVASIYTHVPFKQDSAYLAIGERTNANGSKAFRDAMLEARWDDCVDIARGQTRDGAHLLDLCVDYVGRDGVQDMKELAGRFATASTLPIMLDSTEPAVLQAGLEMLGGRVIINSVNFEDGDGPESRYSKIMPLVQEHGTGVVVMCIDEQGQARTAERKVEIASRTIDELVAKWGMRVEDIFVDCLAFTIGAGLEESRKDGLETLEGIKLLKQRYPDVQTTLGLSNISFGLNPAARIVLNSVYPERGSEGRAGLRDRARLEDPADGAHPRGTAQRRPGPHLRPAPPGHRRHPRLRPAAEVPRTLRGRRRRVDGRGQGRGTARPAAVRAVGEAGRRRRPQGTGRRPGSRAGRAARAGDHQRDAAVRHEDRR